jgi:hypothetical protein
MTSIGSLSSLLWLAFAQSYGEHMMTERAHVHIYAQLLKDGTSRAALPGLTAGAYNLHGTITIISVSLQLRR